MEFECVHAKTSPELAAGLSRIADNNEGDLVPLLAAPVGSCAGCAPLA
jgi:hypothetical protein